MAFHGRKLRSVLATALLFGSAAFATTGTPSSGDERIVIETDPTLKAGVASIDLRCPLRAARAYIDSTYAGTTPYESGIAPGAHVIRVEAPGYYPLSISLVLEQKTLYTITFNPALVMGSLSVGVEPAGAALSLSGKPLDPGLVELPVGTYSLVARLFGYEEKRIEVEIEENATTRADISLEKAAFSVSDFRATRATFNPGNAGAAGKTDIVFTASTYGSARVEILGPDGAVVRAFDFPRIETWKQAEEWDGRGEGGERLSDGTYVARLRAVPAPGMPIRPEGRLPEGEVSADGSIVLETEIGLDSTIRVRPLGAMSAMPGLAAFPDPLPQPAGTTAVEAAWLAPTEDASGSALGLSLSSSLGGVVALSLSGATELGEEGAADLAASILVSLLADRASGSGGAIFVRASWSSASEPSMPESRSAVEVSTPWALSFGDFRLGAAPGALIDFSSPPEVLALARAGLWLDGRSLRAGLSGALPFGLGLAGREAGPRWPARIAAEARLMLGSSPFTISAYALADISPDGGASFLAGLGVGLLF